MRILPSALQVIGIENPNRQKHQAVKVKDMNADGQEAPELSRRVSREFKILNFDFSNFCLGPQLIHFGI